MSGDEMVKRVKSIMDQNEKLLKENAELRKRLAEEEKKKQLIKKLLKD
jgi:regulator of replication initiation timing